MIKVAYMVQDPNEGSSFYRTSFVFPYLNSSEIRLVDFSGIEALSPHYYVNLDVLILQRPSLKLQIDIMKLAKSMGVRIIIDHDDNLLEVPVSNPTHAYFEQHIADTIICLRMADEVWVTTKKLKECYSVYNSNIHIIPNAHNDYLFPINKKRRYKQNGRKIAYRGAVTHEVDLYTYLDEIVKLIASNADWEFHFIGSRFPYLESKTADNYVMTNPMPLMGYHKYLHNYNPNIFFYPLENTIFNQCKSNCSFLEATYAGAAFIGNDDLTEFSDIPIASFGSGFTEIFDWMMANDNFCKDLHDNAWDYICNNRLLSNVNKLRTERLLHV